MRKNKILAIFNLKGELPTMTAYEIGEKPEEFGFKRNFKVALVDTNE